MLHLQKTARTNGLTDGPVKNILALPTSFWEKLVYSLPHKKCELEKKFKTWIIGRLLVGKRQLPINRL